MKNNLDKIKLGYSGLSNEIFLFRHGKDPQEALDKRNAEKDVMTVITLKMLDGAEKWGSMDYRLGEQWYKLTVEKIDKEKDIKNDKKNF